MSGPAFEGSFEFVEHTADLAVRLRARALTGVFAAAAAAFTEAVTDGGTVRAVEERRVRLSAAELELLLVDWLNELLFLFETEEFLAREADVEITSAVADIGHARDAGGPGDGYLMSARVRGERRDADRHPLKVLIKGITYHGLHIVRTADGYETTVIFDI